MRWPQPAGTPTALSHCIPRSDDEPAAASIQLFVALSLFQRWLACLVSQIKDMACTGHQGSHNWFVLTTLLESIECFSVWTWVQISSCTTHCVSQYHVSWQCFAMHVKPLTESFYVDRNGFRTSRKVHIFPFPSAVSPRLTLYPLFLSTTQHSHPLRTECQSISLPTLLPRDQNCDDPSHLCLVVP